MGNPSFQANGPNSQEGYTIGSGKSSSDPFINVFATRDPTTYDANYPVKKRWLNINDTSNVREWILKDFTNASGQTLANWILISSTNFLETITGDDGVTVSPDANDNINLLGHVVANGTHAKAVFTQSPSANTEDIDVQVSAAIASTNIAKVGLSAFSSAHFTVDANGFTDNKAATAQAASAFANAGIASFLNSQFTVDANGFVQLVGGTGPALLTLSDNANTKVSPDSTGNIQLKGQLNEQVGSFSTTTSDALNHLIKLNPMSSARWIVDPLSTATNPNGTHTTIASAITSATSGDTIMIMPGIYTENLTLKAGVNLVAFNADALTPNVTIIGKCSFTSTGGVSISGIQLKTNSDYFLSVTGSNACGVNLINCYLNCNNNTGIQFTNSNASSSINIDYCRGNLGTTGIGLYTMSGTNTLTSLNISYCYLTNSGASLTNSTCSSGNVNINYSFLFFSCAYSSAAFGNLENNVFEVSNLNITALAFTGTGLSTVKYCRFNCGNAVCLTTGAGTTIYTFACDYITTNASQQTSAGTINPASYFPNLSAYKSGDSANATGDGTNVTIICDTVQGGNLGNYYNTASGVYTAPRDGVYRFTYNIGYGSLGAGHTSMAITLNSTPANYPGVDINPANGRTAANEMTLSGAWNIYLLAGQTASIVTNVQNSTKTVTIRATYTNIGIELCA